MPPNPTSIESSRPLEGSLCIRPPRRGQSGPKCPGKRIQVLLAHFDSDAAHATSMSDLRHMILPPSFLSKIIRKLDFCLWLLHPELSFRPTTREILQSEVFSGLQEAFVEDLSSSVEQDDAESELLMHFLSSLNEQKRKDASKLVEDIRCLEADIEEVKGGQRPKEHFAHPCLRSDSSLHGRKNGFCHKEPSNSDVISPLSPVSNTNESRLIRNIGQLESAYFSMRSKIQLPETDATACVDKELLNSREIWSCTQKDEEKQIPTDRPSLRVCAMIEMPNKSKLRCVSWNNYIKNYLVSTDYDCAVKLWYASTCQSFSQYNEHEKRAWSVYFSLVCPTKLASGSDDCSVKLWSVNEACSRSFSSSFHTPFSFYCHTVSSYNDLKANYDTVNSRKGFISEIIRCFYYCCTHKKPHEFSITTQPIQNLQRRNFFFCT